METGLKQNLHLPSRIPLNAFFLSFLVFISPVPDFWKLGELSTSGSEIQVSVWLSGLEGINSPKGETSAIGNGRPERAK